MKLIISFKSLSNARNPLFVQRNRPFHFEFKSLAVVGVDGLDDIITDAINLVDYEFAQFACYFPAEQLMVCQCLDHLADDRSGGGIKRGRGRDDGYPPPPAQIRTCRIAAYDSCLR
jgi:hypothetical protein